MDKNSKILKNATKDLHDATEAVFRSKAIMDGGFVLQDYCKLLSASLLYINAIEKPIGQHWPTYAILLDRKRLAIEQDLAEIRIHRAVHRNVADEQSEDAYLSLGKIYVIIGSMLGNSVIYKYIKDLPAFEGRSFHYLTLHQGEVSEIWKEFISRVDLLDAKQFQSLLTGARAGYELLQNIVANIEA